MSERFMIKKGGVMLSCTLLLKFWYMKTAFYVKNLKKWSIFPFVSHLILGIRRTHMYTNKSWLLNVTKYPFGVVWACQKLLYSYPNEKVRTFARAYKQVIM